MNRTRRDAFTLVELLAVMCIAALLITMATMAFGRITVGSELTRGGQMIADMVMLARQEAVTRNIEVQVRFYELPDRPGGYGAIQLWRVVDSPTPKEDVPLTPLRKLPVSVIVSKADALSTLLGTASTTKGSGPLPGYTTAPLPTYDGFRFRPTGALNCNVVADKKYFVTVVNALPPAVGATPPPNYYNIAINPITGRAAVFRP